MSYLNDNVSSRDKDHLTKIPTPEHENSFFELLVRVVQDTPKTYRLLLLPLAAPIPHTNTQVESKFLVLKTSCISDLGLRDPL